MDDEGDLTLKVYATKRGHIGRTFFFERLPNHSATGTRFFSFLFIQNSCRSSTATSMVSAIHLRIIRFLSFFFKSWKTIFFFLRQSTIVNLRTWLTGPKLARIVKHFFNRWHHQKFQNQNRNLKYRKANNITKKWCKATKRIF